MVEQRLTETQQKIWDTDREPAGETSLLAWFTQFWELIRALAFKILFVGEPIQKISGDKERGT